MHFCPHLTFLKLEYVLLLILPCNVVGWTAIGAITIVWTNTKLVMVVPTSITFVELSTLFILCLGFVLYLKYLQRIIFCFGTETVYAERQGNRTAGCQFYISKAHVYHWKYNINLIYSYRVTAKCFTRLLWAELILLVVYIFPAKAHSLKST